MPRRRFLKLDPQKRLNILEAAKAEFAENGFDNASYNTIIKRAGLSKGAMYYYFDDKLDLYVTVLEDVTEKALVVMGYDDNVELGGSFWEAMREMCVRAWTFALEHPEMAALLKSISAFPPQIRREGRLGELDAKWRSMLIEMLKQGQAQGEIRTDQPIELLSNVAYALDEAVDMWLIDNMDVLADDPVEQVVGMVLDYWMRLLKP